MRRLALVGLLLALPFVAVPLVGAATGGGASGATLSEFRNVAPVPSSRRTAEPVVSPVAGVRRVSFLVTRAAAVEVTIRRDGGGFFRRLGNFTVPARQRLVLAWDGRTLPAGKYTAVVETKGSTVRAPFEVRRSGDANDADRQPVREPRHG